jgi:ATP-dependent DNA helicase RecG
MISPADIRLLMAAGEGYNAEFKVTVPSKVKELTEEICAFANAAGGVVLIGVNDANQVVGVTLDNTRRSAIQNSISDITPPLRCTLSVVELDGKTIGVIEVPSGPSKPYVLSGAIYMRIGPNTQKLTTAEQMQDFFQQSEKIYFDQVPCPDFQPETMVDSTFLAHFKAESRISSPVPDEQLFQSLKLYTPGAIFKNGAVLFFGRQPEAFFEKAVVRCVAFQGTTKRYIVDDKVYGGNLYAQYTQAMQWLRGKLNVRYDIEGQGSGPRKEIWEIPETTLKEVIINSLSHRDYYEKGAVTMVEFYDDRVEVSNPGGLVSAVPESEFGRRSHSRNPLVFGLFSRMHLVEQVGSGIGRIRELMEAAGLPEPVFQKQGMFTVTMQRPGKTPEKPSEKTSEKTSEKILRLIGENNQITIEELSEQLGRSTRAVEMQIKTLKDRNLLERIGPDKGGYWQLVDKE